jgi:hypothetical protein
MKNSMSLSLRSNTEDHLISRHQNFLSKLKDGVLGLQFLTGQERDRARVGITNI